MSKGEFGTGTPPAAAIELSSHGIYETGNSEVLLAERFDAYDGVSISLHTDSHSKNMHLFISVGAGNSYFLVGAEFMVRAVGLLREASGVI